MPDEIQVEALDACRYRIARDERRGMRTDVVVYASEALMAQIRKDLSLEQAMNVATLPESQALAWRCRTFIKATDSRSAAWRPWISPTAWCRPGA